MENNKTIEKWKEIEKEIIDLVRENACEYEFGSKITHWLYNTPDRDAKGFKFVRVLEHRVGGFSIDISIWAGQRWDAPVNTSSDERYRLMLEIVKNILQEKQEGKIHYENLIRLKEMEIFDHTTKLKKAEKELEELKLKLGETNETRI